MRSNRFSRHGIGTSTLDFRIIHSDNDEVDSKAGVYARGEIHRLDGMQRTSGISTNLALGGGFGGYAIRFVLCRRNVGEWI